MGGNHFDQLAQEILKQKQLMEKLEAENYELRRQLADLRNGRGIFVDIGGIRFALKDDSSLVQTTSASSVPARTSTLRSTVATPAPAAMRPDQPTADVPTAERAEIPSQSQEQSGKVQVSQSMTDENATATSGEPTFLEEIMIDEFSSALTSPSAVWSDPTTEKKLTKQQRKPQEPIDEKQKEALRRELMGSYLLE